MSQPVLLKVYASLWPVSQAEYTAITVIARSAMPQSADNPRLELTDGLLKIAFEGIYFPVDEILETLQSFITREQQGKLDELNLEEWRLTRHIIAAGKIEVHSAPLNNVLDYSGH